MLLQDSLIVQSAVSAFNNAALFDPAFFWVALLMLPLFIVVKVYGKLFLDSVGWKKDNIMHNIVFWTVGLSVAWILLFGGNYNVMRDNVSLVPFITAFVGFVAMLFLAKNTKNIQMPKWKSLTKKEKFKYILFVLILLGVVGLSDTHTWWGPILQIVGFVSGAIIGRCTSRNISDVPVLYFVVFAIITAILMQPELFRFGQLGNLTILHLLGILIVGLPISAVLALRNVKPKEKIHQSAFVKIKWLMRCLTVLAIVLFILTESVIVFLGSCALFFCLIALGTLHSKTTPMYLSVRLLYISLIGFGIVTIMPVIACLGILGWITLPKGDLWQESKFLL